MLQVLSTLHLLLCRFPSIPYNWDVVGLMRVLLTSQINEAFALQATWCVEVWGIDPQEVNPNGGTIVLGHPLGCTGARQIATLLHKLHQQKQPYGVISMCIGTGMGAAGVMKVET